MKNVKKVIALMLAMVMMLSVVSVSAFAADTTNASFGIAFKDADENAITEAKVGDIVDVYVSIKTNGYSAVFAFLSCYDATALTHVKENATALGSAPNAKTAKEVLGRFASTDAVEDDALIAHEEEMATLAGADANGEVIDWGSGSLTVTPHKDAMYPSTWGDAEKAQYKCINLGYLAASDYSNLTVNTKGEFEELVRYRFICIKDTTLNSSVFFKSPDSKKTYISIDPDNEPLANYQVSSPIDVSNLQIEYEGGVTPPPASDPITVENITTQVQWQDKDNGKMRVAFRGNIKNYDLNLADGSQTEIADISEMGVVYSKENTDPTVGGTNCTDVKAWTIYDFVSGGYFFRAVVGNYPHDNTETLYAKAYIIIDGQTIYAPNAMTTTGADAYAAGVANGMSAK